MKAKKSPTDLKVLEHAIREALNPLTLEDIKSEISKKVKFKLYPFERRSIVEVYKKLMEGKQ